jgi:excisionase family DNA binding protein
VTTLLTVEQAAERLAMTERGVRRLIANEGLTVVRLGRTIRIDAEDLESFVAAHKHRRADQHQTFAPFAATDPLLFGTGRRTSRGARASRSTRPDGVERSSEMS